MSSIVAHLLTGASVSLINSWPTNRSTSWKWSLWLMLLAIFPDIDYFIDVLNSKHHSGLRITHSLIGSLFLPFCTVVFLRWREQSKWHTIKSPEIFRGMMLQVVLAGMSHLILDMLVGVTPFPPLWPFWGQTIRLPFGILPSAGRLWPLSAYYVYHNLVIELGVMVPLLYGIFLLFQKSVAFRWRSISVLWFCSGICMYWASTLSRPKV
jgi:inner membrane protein